MNLLAAVAIGAAFYAVAVLVVAGLLVGRRTRETSAFMLFAFGSAILFGTIAALLYIGVVENTDSTLSWATWIFLQKANWFNLIFWLRLAAVVTQAKSLRPMQTTGGFSVALVAAVLAGIFVPIEPVVAGVAIRPHILGIAIVALFVIAAAVAAWRKAAAKSTQRRRAAAYLVAFGLHDLALLAISIPEVLVIAGKVSFESMLMTYAVAIPVLILGFLPAVAYGFLTGKVDGLDRRYRVGLSNTAAAAIIAATFVVVTESIESIFDIQNWALASLVAVALAFAFAPIQNMTTRLAARIMPGQSDLVAEYERALRAALADGTITPDEQNVLDGLRRRLKAQ